MDPVTIAVILRETLRTAVEVRQIFTSSEDPEKDYLELISKIDNNLEKRYSDYDPNLEADLANAANNSVDG